MPPYRIKLKRISGNKKYTAEIRRQKIMEVVLENTCFFGLCDHCGNISLVEAPDCGICGAYNFSISEEEITQRAKELGSIPVGTFTLSDFKLD